MTWIAIRDDVTVIYPLFEMTGEVLFDVTQSALVHHDPVQGEEHLSTDLTSSGFMAGPGECFIKDWSEHSGFAPALVEAGVVEILGEVQVGPHRMRAYRVRVRELPLS